MMLNELKKQSTLDFLSFLYYLPKVGENWDNNLPKVTPVIVTEF